MLRVVPRAAFARGAKPSPIARTISTDTKAYWQTRAEEAKHFLEERKHVIEHAASKWEIADF